MEAPETAIRLVSSFRGLDVTKGTSASTSQPCGSYPILFRRVVHAVRRKNKARESPIVSRPWKQIRAKHLRRQTVILVRPPPRAKLPAIWRTPRLEGYLTLRLRRRQQPGGVRFRIDHERPRFRRGFHVKRIGGVKENRAQGCGSRAGRAYRRHAAAAELVGHILPARDDCEQWTSDESNFQSPLPHLHRAIYTHKAAVAQELTTALAQTLPTRTVHESRTSTSTTDRPPEAQSHAQCLRTAREPQPQPSNLDEPFLVSTQFTYDCHFS